MLFKKIPYSIIFSLLILFIIAPVNGQSSKSKKISSSRKKIEIVRFASGDSALKIPLEIDNNIILIRVSVNDSKPLKFIFDTGASFSVINSERAAELGLKPQGKARGNGTGGKIQGTYTTGVSLGVQGAEIPNQLIALLPFPANTDFEFDGVIGYDFINQFVVEIDYENKIMNLYNPQTYAYSGNGRIIPLLLKGRKTPLVSTKIILEGRATPIEANLEVDTGADNTFTINSPFVKKQGLLKAISKTTQQKQNGAGGEQQLVVGRVKTVQFGQVSIDNPPIGLSQDTEGSGASKENDGLIGGEIFRRFKVILDYSRKQMILEPNNRFGEPFEIDNDN